MKRLGTRIGLSACLVAVALAVVSGAAGCGGSGASRHALDGTSWRLTGWTLDSLAPEQFTITAAFADGKISGTSAVNTYGGAYSTGAGGSSAAGAGGAFSVGQLASTEMAGPEPAMRAEGAYITLLRQARSYTLAGDTLTLYDGNGNQSLIFARANL
jgi:heat shock protein HslJ